MNILNKFNNFIIKYVVFQTEIFLSLSFYYLIKSEILFLCNDKYFYHWIICTLMYIVCFTLSIKMKIRNKNIKKIEIEIKSIEDVIKNYKKRKQEEYLKDIENHKIYFEDIKEDLWKYCVRK